MATKYYISTRTVTTNVKRGLFRKILETTIFEGPVLEKDMYDSYEEAKQKYDLITKVYIGGKGHVAKEYEFKTKTDPFAGEYKEAGYTKRNGEQHLEQIIIGQYGTV